MLFAYLSFRPVFRRFSRTLLLTLLLMNSSCTSSKAIEKEVESSDVWPDLVFEIQRNSAIELQITELIAEMTLAQKIAQMIQPEIGAITVEDMREYGFGSYLNGGGSFPYGNKYATASDWVALAETMYQASIDDSVDGSTIPTMWGTDAVHGHNNVIGATLFPHNIGLGASNNPELIEHIATITAREVKATGIDWVFAPTVAVATDARWGRTYESYSEDPAIVKAYAAAIVHGLQGYANKNFLTEGRVIATTKHFIGDGGTSGIDQGNNVDFEQQLFDIHAQGYVAGLAAGAQTVMASFNSWQGEKIHGSHYLLTQVLKRKMGFDGVVVGDWNGHGQILGCSNDNCSKAVNAGLDIYMVPTKDWKPLFNNLVMQVESGEISIVRINDAVSRILRVKLRAGLFEKPAPAMRKYAGKRELIGAETHRNLARQAVRESLVLLKNNGNLLPLAANKIVMVAGDGADNIAKQSGGWSLSWQGTGNSNADFPQATSIFSGIKTQVAKAGGKAFLSESGRYAIKPDVAIVVFGEEPYAEGYGDLDNLEYQRGNKRDLALLQRLKAAGIPVVSVFISGRPLWVNAELNASDAFVAAWLPGSEGEGVAQVLFADAAGRSQYDFTGKLPFSWPNSPLQSKLNYRLNDPKTIVKGDSALFPLGFGLSYADSQELAELDEFVKLKDGYKSRLAVFDLGIIKPWKLELSSKSKSSSDKTQDEIRKPKAVKTKKIRFEDGQYALSISFNGSSKAEVSFKELFPRDLRAFDEQPSVLSISINVDVIPSDNVELSVRSDSAGKASVDITKQILNLENQGEQIVTVDLNCFKKLGVDFSDVTSPFMLSTKGELSMMITQIEWISQETIATVQCE